VDDVLEQIERTRSKKEQVVEEPAGLSIVEHLQAKLALSADEIAAAEASKAAKYVD